MNKRKRKKSQTIKNNLNAKSKRPSKKKRLKLQSRNESSTRLTIATFQSCVAIKVTAQTLKMQKTWLQSAMSVAGDSSNLA
jgi:hypothetical protein